VDLVVEEDMILDNLLVVLSLLLTAYHRQFRDIQEVQERHQTHPPHLVVAAAELVERDRLPVILMLMVVMEDLVFRHHQPLEIHQIHMEHLDQIQAHFILAAAAAELHQVVEHRDLVEQVVAEMPEEVLDLLIPAVVGEQYHNLHLSQKIVEVVPVSSSSLTQHKYLKTSNVYRKTPTNWSIHQT
jgi:hypothetical protein